MLWFFQNLYGKHFLLVLFCLLLRALLGKYLFNYKYWDYSWTERLIPSFHINSFLAAKIEKEPRVAALETFIDSLCPFYFHFGATEQPIFAYSSKNIWARRLELVPNESPEWGFQTSPSFYDYVAKLWSMSLLWWQASFFVFSGQLINNFLPRTLEILEQQGWDWSQMKVLRLRFMDLVLF